jgi:hypothetical protein
MEPVNMYATNPTTKALQNYYLNSNIRERENTYVNKVDKIN